MADYRAMGGRKPDLWGKDKGINPMPWQRAIMRNFGWRAEQRLGSACPAALIDAKWSARELKETRWKL